MAILKGEMQTDNGDVLHPITSADSVKFDDGENFQEKLNSGSLKGAKGDKGDQGLQGIPGKDGLTTSVNGITQVNGNIDISGNDIIYEPGDISITQKIQDFQENSDARFGVFGNLFNNAFDEIDGIKENYTQKSFQIIINIYADNWDNGIYVIDCGAYGIPLMNASVYTVIEFALLNAWGPTLMVQQANIVGRTEPQAGTNDHDIILLKCLGKVPIEDFELLFTIRRDA